MKDFLLSIIGSLVQAYKLSHGSAHEGHLYVWIIICPPRVKQLIIWIMYVVCLFVYLFVVGQVRREKISERMKYLQELVPGCNKVTGKAVMLDEIINYVQSLQQQVEFLSMKLAAVNPRLDFNVDSILKKEAPQLHTIFLL
jgi:hypothetical protein